MHSSWILFIVVWVIAEVVGYFRKADHKKRAKTAAIWATILGSLSAAGGTPSDESILPVLGILLIIYGLVALVIYWFRLKIVSVSISSDN
jgi:hypothetical protein